MSDALWPDRTIGVFETLLVVGGTPIELDAHLRRLSASVGELFGAAVPREAREIVLNDAISLGLGRLRLTVSPALGGLSVECVTASVSPANVFPSWQLAIALRPFVRRGGLGAHKWADRTGLAWTESTEPEGGLPLILDVEEEVLEASRANIFVADGETLITPRADGRILPGVARAQAIDAARSLGIEVREQQLTVEQLLAARQAFLTGSVRGVEPVRAVGDVDFEPPGACVSALARELRSRWLGADTLLAAP